MHALRSVSLVLFTLTVLGACAHEPEVRRRPPPCQGAEWVPGHKDESGDWVAASWRCPGTRRID
jgi:hypothetical protein